MKLRPKRATPQAARAAATSSEIHAVLLQLAERARRTWPALAVDDATLVARFAQGVKGAPDPLAALRALHVADLLVACAYERQLPRAVAFVEREIIPTTRIAVRRIHASDVFVTDVWQRLREKLLLQTPGHRPKIADYSGRGPLRSWVRSLAIGTALNLLRQTKGSVLLDEHLWEEPIRDNPELQYLKGQFEEQFARSLQGALKSLSPRQRTLLRLHFLSHLNIDEIGKLFQVHRSTAARWLAQTQEDLVRRTRRALSARLTRSERQTMAALVKSHLDVSLRGFLSAEEDAL